MADIIDNGKGQYVLPPGLMRIHAELCGELTPEEESILKNYGGVRRGRTISRDLIVSEDMPLICLHMALQRAFGFHSVNDHAFTPGDEAWQALTSGTFADYDRLRGIIFADSDYGFMQTVFDYPGGGFVKWHKETYSRDYYDVLNTHRLSDYHPLARDRERCRNDQDFRRENCHCFIDLDTVYCGFMPAAPDEGHAFVQPWFAEAGEFEERNPDLAGYFGFARPAGGGAGRYERCSREDPDAWDLRVKMRLGDLPWSLGSIASGHQSREIIERLPLKNVLAVSSDYLPFDAQGKPAHQVTDLVRHPDITDADVEKALKEGREILPRPFTDFLIYEYDFKDRWRFAITGSRGCSDLTESGAVSCEDARRAAEKCLTSAVPVLLAMDGDMLFANFGGLEGFLRFLNLVRLDPGMEIREVTSFFDDARWADELFEDSEDQEEHEARERQDREECRAAQNQDVQKWLDENDAPDSAEGGLSRANLLLRAIEYGWHRNDFKPEELL